MYKRYKSKSPQTHCNNEPMVNNPRRYSSVFDRTKPDYKRIEPAFYNMPFAEEGLSAKKNMRCYDFTGKTDYCDRELRMTFKKEEKICYAGDGWSVEQKGDFLTKGNFKIW